MNVRGVLVLLVFGDQVLHVALGFGEFHLVHTLLGVPVQEGLPLEHGAELVCDTLEQLLDGSRVADEGDGHLEATRSNVALGSEDVVGNPLDEERAVLVLNDLHLVLDLLHGHLATEVGRDGEVATMSWVGSSHHVLGIEHLLGEFGNSDSAVLLRATSGKRSEADHEEVETGERNHVDSQLPEIGVELTRETKARGDTAHDDRDEVVEVAVSGSRELQGLEADFV